MSNIYKEKMRKKQIFKWLLILSLLSIIFYYIYPYFISIEQANRDNIKKFNENKDFFQGIADSCIENYKNNSAIQQKGTISFEELTNEGQKTLINKGIHYFESMIENKNGKISIIAVFYTEKFWHNRVLNHVVIKYSSHRKFDICNENNLKASINNICLGDGWFFEIDLDWL